MYDGQRIDSILQNLVMNAVKFSHKGGKINIQAYFIESEEDNNKKEIKISVADTGIGITDEVKESLFTMFRRITKLVNVKQTDYGKLGSTQS